MKVVTGILRLISMLLLLKMVGKGHRQGFDSFPMSDETLVVLVLGQVYPVETVDALVLKKTGN